MLFILTAGKDQRQSSLLVLVLVQRLYACGQTTPFRHIRKTGLPKANYFINSVLCSPKRSSEKPKKGFNTFANLKTSGGDVRDLDSMAEQVSSIYCSLFSHLRWVAWLLFPKT